MNENPGPERRPGHSSFASSYRHHRPIVLAYCARRALSFHDAEDATEEAFEIAWAAGGEKSTSIAWLIAVARNVLRNRARRVIRDRELVIQLRATPDHGSNLVEAIVLAIDALPAVDRRIIYLTYWCGLSATEIAAATGSTSAAVWTRLTRIRGTLRLALVTG